MGNKRKSKAGEQEARHALPKHVLKKVREWAATEALDHRPYDHEERTLLYGNKQDAYDQGRTDGVADGYRYAGSQLLQMLGLNE